MPATGILKRGSSVCCALISISLITSISVLLYYPRESEGICFTGVGLCASVCVSVCLSVTTITKKIEDGFVPNFM